MVRNLMRKASAELLDRGLSVLYVAFGVLDWQDLDGTEMVSPLLLVPVKLVSQGPKSTPYIVEDDEEDSLLNPALTLRLREFGIDLPSEEDIEGISVSETLSLVRGALKKKESFSDWTLRESTYLATFSFAKEAMYKDLLDNEETIVEHGIVKALATSDPTQQSSEFQFDPIAPSDIDRLAPPEDVPLVLDADSSQRAAVAAALATKTFVMDGPPGTGKSQTIANIIGALLHAGQSVLFVSEKMAALEVVRNRLAAAGLGSYLLELHSHKASRKEVATELLKTLDNVVKPPVAMPFRARQGARDRREQLNNYADAMHERRTPLNRSLHDVLGQYANLSTAPIAPVPENAPRDLTEVEYLEIQETLNKLIRAWRPAAQGRSFLWREVIDTHSLEVRLYQADSALEELRGTIALNSALVETFGLSKPPETPQLLALIEHQRISPAGGVMEHWLTAESMDSTLSARAELGRHLAQLRTAEGAVTQAAGVAWTSLPDEALLPPEPEPPMKSFYPLYFSTVTVSELTSTADRFESDARLLGDRLAGLNSLANNLGLEPIVTFADADRLARFVELRSLNVGFDRRWFTTAGLADARQASVGLSESAAALSAAETKASSVFTTEAVEAPLADLQDRFENLHKGLRKLSGKYRADKRTIAGLLTEASEVKVGISRLADAVAWSESHKAFDGVTRKYGPTLGQHWAGRDTNFEAVDAALNLVEEILALTDGQVPTQLVNYLTATDSNRAFQSVADSASVDFARWKSKAEPAPALAPRPELLLEPIDRVIDWLSAHALSMRQAAQRVGAVDQATGGSHCLAEVKQLLTLAKNAKQATEELQAAEPLYRATFGTYFDSGNTACDALEEAVDWASQLRELTGRPLTGAQIKTLSDCNYVDSIGSVYGKWTQARDRIVAAFSTSRHEELISELDEFNGAVELMNDLRTDTVGQQEWFDYQSAYADLARRGLDTAIDFCIEQRVPENEVADVVNRALLRSWSDAVIQGDERLRPLLATDREALVEEYRKIDRELIRAATADIIKAANTRRPANTTMGESAVIRREGSKQKRHIPVRELIGRARTVTSSIKPVFMMSPLAVSQYLPADMEFDVVIFDEASQVTPGDAINCIYRSKALILAGDDKQLPPTSFFERNSGDEDTEDDTDVKDFQSVLELAKATGAFNNLGLRWHYRSRHEGLIAFSNYKFYEGKLVTFPSAHSEGENIGVEFFNAEGTYRRGGGAYNPVEAEKVAERVMEHLTRHPELTLGVVTFSVAQADAVQNAIDEARMSRRDLDRFFDTEDRLDGFFIRALEQVQGDERDVIIFSIGYGPDEAGKVSTNFGALNKDKGWRRLNVGITRARQRVEVVASMCAGQIPPSTNENVEYFRGYLDYAERGSKTLAIPYASTGLDPESPFEESVLAAIRGWGYTVEPQVGAAGFRIDIGVRHPARPGMFAIGIECDGYQYHSAPAARDRDRLRDQVLNGLGWRLHRIWGTAWYRDRGVEETRLRSAIEEAIAAPVTTRPKATPRIDHPVVETEEATLEAAPTWTTEYRLAPASRFPRWAEPGDPDSHLHMVDAIQQLVKHEGPVHLDIAYERLRKWWNIGRIGSNIRSNIDRAIQRAQVVRDGDFLMLARSDVKEVRTPNAEVTRKAQHVHVEELALAVTYTVRDVGALDRTELVQGVARIFGWTRTGVDVDRCVNAAIDRAIADEKLVVSGEGTVTLVR